MNKRIIALFSALFFIVGSAKSQTVVTAEEMNADEVKITWGADWSLIEDFETGDFNKFKWENGISDYPWEICTENPYEGNYCMKAGNHNVLYSESAIQVSIEVPFDGVMTFYERISADNGFDCGRFYIDDTLTGLWTAVSDWIKREYEVTQGRHTFKWSYTKETDQNWNDDCFWVDCINFCKDPDPIGSTWISYATPAYFGNVGSGEDETVWASRWPSRELGQYAGYTMTKVGMFSDAQGYTGGEYTVCIHRGATEYTPGDLITSQTVTVPSGLGQYVEYELDSPVFIDGIETIWIIWHQSTVTMPAPACSEIDYYLDGEWFYQGGEWISLFYGAWMMESYLLSPDGKEVSLNRSSTPKAQLTDIAYFNVYRREVTNEPVLIADQVNDTIFTDTEWATMEDGRYQWGVSAVYENKGRSIETPIRWVGGAPRELPKSPRETEVIWSNTIVKNVAGIAENQIDITLYPNPTRSSLTIKAENMKYLEVISLLGQVMYETEIDGSEIVLDLSQFERGIYMLKITTAAGVITRQISVIK